MGEISKNEQTPLDNLSGKAGLERDFGEEMFETLEKSGEIEKIRQEEQKIPREVEKLKGRIESEFNKESIIRPGDKEYDVEVVDPLQTTEKYKEKKEQYKRWVEIKKKYPGERDSFLQQKFEEQETARKVKERRDSIKWWKFWKY